MAGTNPGFDSAAFVSGIHFAMEMGAPPDDSQRVTFYFPSVVTWDSNVDGDNVAFDPDATPTVVGQRKVQVPCAVQYFDRDGNELAFGDVATTKLILTLLGEDYDQVKGCEYVVASGDRYNVKRQPPTMGIFNVAVNQIIADAIDEN